MRKPIIIGQAPARSGCGPLEGPSGRRLARCFGLSYEDYLERFKRFNCLVEWPGPSGRGDAFQVQAARDAMVTSLESGLFDLDGRDVMLLGKGLPRVFGLEPLLFDRGAVRFVMPRRVMHFRYFLFPHPSGVSAWWNSREQRREARRLARAWLESISCAD